MKKISLFISLIVLVGVGGWALGYSLSTSRAARAAHSPDAMLEWLRVEYHLTCEQYSAIKTLHDRYVPQARELTKHAADCYELLAEALGEKPINTGKVVEAASNFVKAKNSVKENFNRHIDAVAAAMSPNESERYLESVKNRVRE